MENDRPNLVHATYYHLRFNLFFDSSKIMQKCFFGDIATSTIKVSIKISPFGPPFANA